MFSLQLAQNLSDNLVSMATADATVRATMASLEETNNENMPSEPLVVVHSREEVANNNNRTADMNQPTVRPSVGGAEGGQDNSNVGEHAETDNKKPRESNARLTHKSYECQCAELADKHGTDCESIRNICCGGSQESWHCQHE